MSLEELSIGELATRCREETAKFRLKLQHDTRFCFELFRLAFSQHEDDASSAINEEAFTEVYRIYLPLVFHWVYQHVYFQPNIDLAEDFVSDAMYRFFKAVHHDFSRFTSLAGVLTYIKRCVHTAIVSKRRKQQATYISIDEVPHMPDPGSQYQFQAVDVWDLVREVLSDEDSTNKEGQAKDLLLAQLAFIQRLKPREIVAMYPEIWSTTDAYRKNRSRVAERLKQNETLLDYLGMKSKQNKPE